MSIGNTREWLDADQHVEAYFDYRARITSDACVLIKREQEAGYKPGPYQDEKSPDGRSIYRDHQGYYRATKEELGK